MRSKGEYVWIDAKSSHEYTALFDHVGITYRGFSFHPQAGGGFFGGFQSRNEFLTDGPLHNMPKDMERIIKGLMSADVSKEYAIELKNGEDRKLSLSIYLQVNDTPVVMDERLELDASESIELFSTDVQPDRTLFELMVVRYEATGINKNRISWRTKRSTDQNEIATITISDGDLVK